MEYVLVSRSIRQFSKESFRGQHGLLRSVSDWVSWSYQSVSLPDARLKKRLFVLSEALFSRPLDSMNQALGSWSGAKGAYRFIENDSVSAEDLKAPIADATALACNGEKEIIVVQDTTTLSFSSARGAEGLGPVNDDSKARGMLLHPALALDTDGSAIGLLDWQSWSRPLTKRSTPEEYRRLPMDQKESGKWLGGMERSRKAMNRILPCEKQARLIHVFDREGDVHEIFENALFCKDGAVVRSSHNRRVLTEDERGALAHEAVRKAPLLGTALIQVPRKQGQKKREAEVQLRCRRMKLTPNRSQHPDREWIDLNLVEVFEAQAPPDIQPLHWLLWTTENATNLEQAMRIVEIYKYRWRIEEFHLILKSGCRIEALQFSTAERLSKVVALYAPIALRILQLRDFSRTKPKLFATAILSEAQWKALWTYIYQKPPPCGTSPPDIRQTIL
ncbi:MAG: IS4 family transposase [Candidatus Sumerlaeia bacterium]